MSRFLLWQIAALCLAFSAWPLAQAEEVEEVVGESSLETTSLCAKSLSRPAFEKRNLSDITKLNFATYNVENLFYYVGQSMEIAPQTYIQMSDARNKNADAMMGIAAAIIDLNLDIAVLAEVESEESLRRFVHDFLDDLYDVHLIEGNDPRGINIAFITKKNLPFEYEYTTHKDDKWIDPNFPDAGLVPLFSRDVPVLKIFAKDAQNRLLHLFSIAGIHNKSRRDRPFDQKGRLVRGAQVKREVEIWNELVAEMGKDARIIMAGDFNGILGRDLEMGPLKKINAIDAIDANGLNQNPLDRITHTSHPRPRVVQNSEIDYIFISPALQKNVARSYVYRYRSFQGDDKPLPRSHYQRTMNPSDHFPKFMELQFQPILRVASRR